MAGFFLICVLAVVRTFSVPIATCPDGTDSCPGVFNEETRGIAILQKHVSDSKVSDELHEEEMRSDDAYTAGDPESPSLVQRNELWPPSASDVLCAMDAVDSMIGIKYPAGYSFFEDDAVLDNAACIATNCLPVVPIENGKLKITQLRCQTMAFHKSHAHYAMGLNPTTGKMRCYTFSNCGPSGRVAAAGFTLYSKPASTPASSITASPITCAGEAAIKETIEAKLAGKAHPSEEPGTDPRQTQPRATILRAVFHDAHDYKSIRAVNKNTNEWELVPSDKGYAGMDGCMYDFPTAEFEAKTELEMMMSTHSGGSAAYNFNLRRYVQNQDPVQISKFAFGFMEDACFDLCCKSSSGLSEGEKATLCGTSECVHGDYLDKCGVDIMTFASLLIIKESKGPAIPMTWGRKQGDCRNPFANVDVPSHLDTRRLAQKGAPLSSFGNAAAIFEEFAGLGFNKSETTALMGAHTYAKIHKYTGGPRTRNRGGGVCNDPSKVFGWLDGKPLTNKGKIKKLLDKYSHPKGKCKPHSLTSEGGLECWTNERGYLEPARDKSAMKDADFKRYLRKAKQDKHKAMMWLYPTWAKGGFWDKTPDVFDNQYFVELSNTDPAERNNCCGPSTEFGCATDDTEGSGMQHKNHTIISGCDVNWCMRSGGKASGSLGGGNPDPTALFPDYAVMSTNRYVQSHTSGDKNNVAQVSVHRIFRLAADWALIDDDEARLVVNEFAQDEGAFHKAFSAVWSKVIQLGYAEGELKQCVP